MDQSTEYSGLCVALFELQIKKAVLSEQIKQTERKLIQLLNERNPAPAAVLAEEPAG